MKKPKPEPCPPTKVGPVSSMLDEMQMVLDVIGFIPVLGEIADGINAVISFLRARYLDAIISIGCLLFSVFGDSLLKPLKWAAGTIVQKVRKIKDQIKSFIPAAKSFIGGIADTVKGNWFLGKNVKDSVSDACKEMKNYLTSIGKQADDVVFETAGSGSGKYTDDVVQVIDKGASGAVERINAENLKYSKSAWYDNRPYQKSTITIQNIIDSLPSGADPKGSAGLWWKVDGAFNGSQGTYELLISPDKTTIWHFLFRSK